MIESEAIPLHHLDAIDAFKLAIEKSGRPLPEIAEEMGWSSSFVRRVFSAEKFFPSVIDIPRFCAVLGNQVIIHWQLSRATFYGLDEAHQDVDCNALLRRVNDLFAEVGDVATEARESIKNNILEPNECRRIIKELSDVLDRGMSLVADLRALERSDA